MRVLNLAFSSFDKLRRRKSWPRLVNLLVFFRCTVQGPRGPSILLDAATNAASDTGPREARTLPALETKVVSPATDFGTSNSTDAEAARDEAAPSSGRPPSSAGVYARLLSALLGLAATAFDATTDGDRWRREAVEALLTTLTAVINLASDKRAFAEVVKLRSVDILGLLQRLLTSSSDTQGTPEVVENLRHEWEMEQNKFSRLLENATDADISEALGCRRSPSTVTEMDCDEEFFDDSLYEDFQGLDAVSSKMYAGTFPVGVRSLRLFHAVTGVTLHEMLVELRGVHLAFPAAHQGVHCSWGRKSALSVCRAAPVSLSVVE